MKTGVIVLIGVAWIGCGPLLSRFMGERGYNAFSWLVVGTIMGPASLALAVMERVSWTQPLPELVVRGETNGGAIDFLVLMDDGDDVMLVAKPLVEWFGACAGRLTIASVHPEGGPLEEQIRARSAIEKVVKRFEPQSAEGMLLFGLTAGAVGAIVRDEGFHVVITAGPNPSVKEALRGTDAIHVDGPQYLPELRTLAQGRARALHLGTSEWNRL